MNANEWNKQVKEAERALNDWFGVKGLENKDFEMVAKLIAKSYFDGYGNGWKDSIQEARKRLDETFVP